MGANDPAAPVGAVRSVAAMVAIVVGLVGMVAGAIGAMQTGSPIGLLMWVPCVALIVLGYASGYSRFAERWGHVARSRAGRPDEARTPTRAA
jgi:phosphatidylglycerophosphate synthase